MRCKISTKHRGSSYRLVLLIFFSIVRFLLQVISHGERNLHSRIRNKKDSAQHKGRKHSAQHKDAKHSAHQQDNTLSSHHSVSASALSLLGDALHNGNKNQNAAFARFKEVRAPFKAGDDPSRKTIGAPTADGTSDGDLGPDNGEDDDNQDDPNTNYKVLPVPTKGLRMEPMPGMKDPTVFVRAPDNYGSNANITKGYVRESQLSSLDMIKDAIDVSENRIKGLKLRVVEKQNFLDSLRKREQMLDSDVAQDQQAIRNLLSHIDALDLRLTRLKKENELKQLSEMYENFTAKAVHLEGQVSLSFWDSFARVCT